MEEWSNRLMFLWLVPLHGPRDTGTELQGDTGLHGPGACLSDAHWTSVLLTVRELEEATGQLPPKQKVGGMLPLREVCFLTFLLG